MRGLGLDDRYETLGQLGEGGMGEVFKAREKDLNRIVAIKILRTELVSDKEHRQRFIREGKILASLDHRNIVSVYKIGVVQDSVYIVCEFVDGVSLSSLIAQSERLSYERAIGLVLQVCDAVAYAHQRGVVHRDLKPANILVDRNDEVKVIDFGLATLVKQGEASKDRLTKTGTMLGTLAYMSPELCRGEKADEKSDIYALGCIIYECLTGQPPLVADHPVGQLYLNQNAIPAPPRSLVKELDPAVDNIIMRCLAKEPSARFASVQDLTAALKAPASYVCDTSSTSTVKSTRGNLAISAIAGLILIMVAGICWSISYRSAWDATASSKNKTGATRTMLGAEGLLALGDRKMREGNAREARALYRNACSIGSSAPKTRMRAWRLYACANIDCGDYVEAEASARKALAISEKLSELKSSDSAEILCVIADCLYRQNRLNEAIKVMDECLALSKHTLGVQSLVYADRLNQAGDLLREANRLDQADMHTREAISIARGVSDENRLCAYLAARAELLIPMGRLVEAERVAREALSISVRSKLPQQADLEFVLCGILDKQKRLNETVDLLSHCLPILKRTNNPKVMPALLLQSHLLLRKHDVAGAEDILKEGFALSLNFPAEERTRAVVARRLAEALIMQGKDEEASLFLSQNLPLAQKLKCSALLELFAETLIHKGEFAKAEAVLNQSRSYWLKPPPTEQIAFKRGLGSCQSALCKLTEAVGTFEELVRLMEAEYGQHSKELVQPLKELASCYQRQGRSDLAQRCEARAEQLSK